MHFPISWPNRRTNDSDYSEGFNDDFYGMQTKTTVFETWEAMEQLVNDGLVKDIGVSNCMHIYLVVFQASIVWIDVKVFIIDFVIILKTYRNFHDY